MFSNGTQEGFRQIKEVYGNFRRTSSIIDREYSSIPPDFAVLAILLLWLIDSMSSDECG
jgi:hypothetical protein